MRTRAPAQCWCKKGAVDSEVNQHIGVSRGGKTTKIHVIVDALGNPVHVHLSAGNLHDSTEAEAALSDMTIQIAHKVIKWKWNK